MLEGTSEGLRRSTVGPLTSSAAGFDLCPSSDRRQDKMMMGLFFTLACFLCSSSCFAALLGSPAAF